MLKVADFGTSRFLEIAAHGTTVIGSPPYMAPEQFHGKAVFASDIYSLGVTMYQMLTGVLPYETPSPADLAEADARRAGRRRRGSRNSRIPKALNDIVMQAMAPAVGDRYQRAGDLLDDLLAARTKWVGSRRAAAPSHRRRAAPRRPRDELQDIQGAAAGARDARAALLLALPQAAARAHRPLPVLRRSAVMLESACPPWTVSAESFDKRGVPWRLRAPARSG